MMATRRWISIAESLLDLRAQRALLRHKIVKTIFLAASLVLISWQQTGFLLLKENPNPFYRNVLNLGASYQRYFSFFYYFGGFPVNLGGQKTSTLEETKATLKTLGSRLAPERDVYDRASIFLLYPDALWKGRPDTAEMRTGHAIWFTLALLSVFMALSYVGMPMLGLLVALLCGSDPFQVYELYHVTSSTIFPTVISTGLIIVAACLLLSSERFSSYRTLSIVLVSLCGAICALQYEIRLEGVGVFAGAALSLIVCFPVSRKSKLVYASLFLISVVVTNTLINGYFRSAFTKANAVVASYGGTPIDSGNPYYSTFWWALWSGLGDFDERYGFLADDRAGLSYSYGRNASTRMEQSLRNSYLETISSNPAWFAALLRRRFARVLLENTPYRITAGSRSFDVNVPPILVTACGLLLLMANVLIQGRNRLKRNNLNLFLLPLSIGLVAIGQLADYGLQFYCIAHLFIFAYVGCCALDGALVFIGWIVNSQRRFGYPPPLR